jgi:hypothetical protein
MAVKLPMDVNWIHLFASITSIRGLIALFVSISSLPGIALCEGGVHFAV